MFENAQPTENAYFGIRQTLPPSSLGYHTNNRYDGFPPLMSDGRTIQASWQPEAVLNTAILQKAGIKSNWEYRQYLTHNAKEIMRMDMSEAANDVGYYKRYLDVDTEDNYPKSLNTPPENAVRTPGYIDRSTDLKQAYMTREQLEARMVSPVVTQAEFAKFASATR
jgi:hypothetical protein